MDRNLLKQILFEQHETDLPNEFHQRDIYQTIKTLQKNPEVLVISGLRRCGKSTVMRDLRKKSKENNYFINFEDDRLINFKLEDFSTLHEVFIELYGVQEAFYFDEIQNIDGWERFVRRLRSSGNKVYVTGSNAKLFSRELGTKLTGRYIDVEMYPYSFREFLQHRDKTLIEKKVLTSKDKGSILHIYSKYLESGGIPEYVKFAQKQYLHDLYESILFKDVIVRHNISNEKVVKELVFYLASHVGKEFSYNNIKKTLGVSSSTTIADYCYYLENCYLCYFVNRYSHSLTKQLQYNKKCYLVDHALARVVGFRPSEDFGRLLENIVFIELKRRGEELYFHKEQKECDFILRREGRIHHAIQVSLQLNNEKTRAREFAGLIEALESYQLSKGTILTENDEGTETITKNNQKYSIDIIPVWKWLLGNSSP